MDRQSAAKLALGTLLIVGSTQAAYNGLKRSDKTPQIVKLEAVSNDPTAELRKDVDDAINNFKKYGPVAGLLAGFGSVGITGLAMYKKSKAQTLSVTNRYDSQRSAIPVTYDDPEQKQRLARLTEHARQIGEPFGNQRDLVGMSRKR